MNRATAFFGAPIWLMLIVPAALLVGYLVAGTAGAGIALAVAVAILAGTAIARQRDDAASILLVASPLLVIALLPATGLGGHEAYDSGTVTTALLVGLALQGTLYWLSRLGR